MNDVRDRYLAWVRRASVVLVLPFLLTAGLQAAASSAWWSTPSPDGGAMRYLFISVAVASVVIGRTLRAREVATAPLDVAQLESLSWRMLVYACAPVAIGAVLGLMTHQLWDYYALLLVTLVGLVVLFPTFAQWVAWSQPPDGEES